MISNRKLNEFFKDDGTPNWGKYLGIFEGIHGEDSRQSKLESEEARDVLRHVDYFYAKKGFLKRSEGYQLVSSGFENFPIFFGFLKGEELFFASQKDAETVKRLINRKRISVEAIEKKLANPPKF